MSDQIQKIKDKNDIVEVVNQYVKLEKAGRNYKALCPFHQEKTPSFMVSPELQIYKCFGCGIGGDVINFVMEMEGVDFPEALEILADRVGIKLRKFKGDPKAQEKNRITSINEIAQEFYSYLLFNHSVGKRGRDYLEHRGISLDTAKEFSLGYAPFSKNSLAKFLLSKDYTLGELVRSGLVKSPGKGHYYDLFRGRLVFPLKNSRGVIVGFSARAFKDDQEPKYINIAETALFKKRQLLYGLCATKAAIKKSKKAIVVEGEFDFLSPYQAGTKNIVAAKGTSLTPEQVKILKRYADTILIAFDADVAGESAVQRGIDLAQEAELDIRVVVLPTGKDPDECVRIDPEGWERAIENAIPVMDFYFNYALEKFSLSEAAGKSKIASYLLPKIRALPDAVAQTHYLQELTEKIEVQEEILRSEMSRLSGSSSVDRAEPLRKHFKTDQKKKSRQQALEEQILSMLLQAPKEFSKTVLYKLAKEDFTGEVTSALFTLFKEYIWEVKRFEIANLKKKLGNEEQKLFEELYLRPSILSLEESNEEFEQEVERIIEELKKQRYHRQLKDLTSKIKRAERENDGKTLKELQEQFQEIAGKIE